MVEFQGICGISTDGVVGQATWGFLDPWIQMLLSALGLDSAAEDAIREKIAVAAETAFQSWGWGTSGIVSPDGSARIAAARGFGQS